MNRIEVAVAVIGKAHGLRGEVVLVLRTDQPRERLREGTVLTLEHDGQRSPLTILAVRTQQERWFVRFAEVTSRTDAEALRGGELLLEVDREQDAEDDPEAWYPAELRGLAVRHVDGRDLGTVVDLQSYPAQDLLIVRGTDGRRVMLPFVRELVPEVDMAERVILADPPGGLFEDLPPDDEA